MRDILYRIISFMFSILKGIFCLILYEAFGVEYALLAAFVFILDEFEAIKKKLYDMEDKAEEMKEYWNPISNIRKRI